MDFSAALSANKHGGQNHKSIARSFRMNRNADAADFAEITASQRAV
jgi:hypothetical protein